MSSLRRSEVRISSPTTTATAAAAVVTPPPPLLVPAAGGGASGAGSTTQRNDGDDLRQLPNGGGGGFESAGQRRQRQQRQPPPPLSPPLSPLEPVPSNNSNDNDIDHKNDPTATATEAMIRTGSTATNTSSDVGAGATSAGSCANNNNKKKSGGTTTTTNKARPPPAASSAEEEGGPPRRRRRPQQQPTSSPSSSSVSANHNSGSTSPSSRRSPKGRGGGSNGSNGANSNRVTTKKTASTSTSSLSTKKCPGSPELKEKVRTARKLLRDEQKEWAALVAASVDGIAGKSNNNESDDDDLMKAELRRLAESEEEVRRDLERCFLEQQQQRQRQEQELEGRTQQQQQQQGKEGTVQDDDDGSPPPRCVPSSASSASDDDDDDEQEGGTAVTAADTTSQQNQQQQQSFAAATAASPSRTATPTTPTTPMPMPMAMMPTVPDSYLPSDVMTRGSVAASVPGPAAEKQSSGNYYGETRNGNGKSNRNANGSGRQRQQQQQQPLSELSKQLRVLQATNQSQSVDIDRLERQLRILADLQNVSVTELRSALEDACASEAFGEWQSRVAALKAELDAASAMSSKSKQQEAVAEAATAATHHHQMANLELRIGELEEVESNHQDEIFRLYQQLKEQTEKATRLELKCRRQEQELEMLRRSNNPFQLVPVTAATAAAVAPVGGGAMVPAATNGTDIVPWAEEARKAEEELHVRQNQLALAEQQHQSKEEQYKLKNAQLQARALVQEERIQDLEQQLSSLYAAFGIIREEQEVDHEQLSALQGNLHQADEQLAMQLDSSERNLSGQRTDGALRASFSSPYTSSTPFAQREVEVDVPPFSQALTIPPPLPSPYRDSRQVQQPPPQSPPARVAEERSTVLYGELQLRTNNRLRKWKKQRAVLTVTLENYQLEVGGNPYVLQFGVSKLDQDTSQPWSFKLLLDPNDRRAQTLYLAATNEAEYDEWVSALLLATGGDEGNTEPVDIDTNRNGRDMALPQHGRHYERENDDLHLALQISQNEH